MTVCEWKGHHRRCGIELIICHSKYIQRMDRNYLMCEVRVRINAILARCGYNLRELQRASLMFFFEVRFNCNNINWPVLTDGSAGFISQPKSDFGLFRDDLLCFWKRRFQHPFEQDENLNKPSW
jgi:hypothetical protein